MEHREYIKMLKTAAKNPMENDEAHTLYINLFSESIECSQLGFLAKIVESFCDYLEGLEDWELENTGHLQDLVYEFANSETDIYTADLTKWLNESVYNVGFLTTALEDGCGYEKDGFKLLQQAQYYAIEEICQIIINGIPNKEAENDNI